MIGIGLTAGMTIISAEHIQVVALYDPESGRIVHLHTVTTLTGGTPPTHEAAIAEAKLRATRRNPHVDGLAVALSNDAEHGRLPHRIDPKTKAFVPLPPEPRGPRPATKKT
jgi:hypothetical protein